MTATLLAFHERWAWVVVVGNGAAGLWSLGAARLRALRTPALWWFTAFVQLAVFVEVGVGVALVQGDRAAAPRFHMFYGFVALVAVGLIYSYRQQVRHRLYLLYGLGGLFVMGLAIRAMVVGRR